MPPLPIPSSSWSQHKGKNATRYPVYAPPHTAATAQALLKAEKKRAIVPSKPLRSPSLVHTERSPLLSASASFQSQSSSSSSTPIPVAHKPGQSSREGLIERRSSHGAAPLSSSPLAQSSFISNGRDSRSSSLPSNHERLPSEPSQPSKPTPSPPLHTEAREPEHKKKPFYRPRPLWLVPFAILAALVRGMTLAPRVQVYTQLACLSSLPSPSLPPISIPDHEPPTKRRKTEQVESGWTPDSAITLYASFDPMGPHLYPAPQLQRVPRALPPPSRNTTFSSLSESSSDDFSASRRPTACSSSPTTQARAARLQTLMTTTTGLLSALSTSFWGRFSSKHGRTRVLAIATLGLLTTDLVFVLVASPSLPWPFTLFPSLLHAIGALVPWPLTLIPNPFPATAESWTPYKQYLLLLGPLVEGSLGGWTTLQSTASAYLSDCTSPGGRAGVFARFTGVFYVGFSVGPVVGGAVVRYFYEGSKLGAMVKAQESVAVVFWVAVVCSFVNFLLVLFVFPESLDKVKAQAASAPSPSLAPAPNWNTKGKAPALSLSSSSLSSPSPSPSHAAYTPITPISHRHPIFPIVEDVEVGGGDGFVDVEDLPSPVSPSSSGFLPARGGAYLASPIKEGAESSSRTPLLLGVPRARSDTDTGVYGAKGSLSAQEGPDASHMLGVLGTLLNPLAVFLPVQHLAPTRNMLHLRYATDWSMTLLAVGLVGWMLSTGVYQIKYLYAGHVYGWGVRELSGYVGWMGFVRAVVLLWIIPSSVSYLKERSMRREEGRRERWEGYVGVNGVSASGGSTSKNVDGGEGYGDGGKGEEGQKRKKQLSRLQLGKSIAFDLRLARVSLFVDFVSNVLIAVTPSPSFHSSIALLQALRGEPPSPSASASSMMASASASGLASSLAATGRHTTITHGQSQAMFVAASSLSALGGGLIPAVHSLALCIVQARSLEPELRAFSRDVEEPGLHGYGSIVTSHYQDIPSDDLDPFGDSDAPKAFPQPVDAATLLSAFAVLQALSQSILAPLLFGFLYAETVQTAPKMVFVLAAGLLMLSFGVVLAVRNPVGEVRAIRRERRIREGLERIAGRKTPVPQGQVVLSVQGPVGGGVVKASLAASKAKATTVGVGAGTPARAIPPSLNLHAKAPVAPMPIVKRWERDMGRRGRSVVSKDLRGGAVSVSVSLGSSYPGQASVDGRQGMYGSLSVGEGYRRGGQYGSLGAQRYYGSVGASGSGSWGEEVTRSA